jgi:hypothetical protein
VADSGRERTVGSHFGLIAKPLFRFINDVVATPDETTAAISWTTVEAGTSQVEFGTTTSFGTTSERSEALTTNHLVNLSGLTPKTGYYFRALSAAGGEEHLSPTYFFTTPYHASTNELFSVTNAWTFSATPQTSADWTTSAFDDSSWGGPGAGLLWVNVRTTGPNPDVGPRNTALLPDATTGYPYFTYYFRTHFALTNLVPGTALQVSAYIDDGAVFYLNGVEVYRLRMPGESNPETLAKGFPCDGDANCLDQFLIESPLLTSLQAGDNVLAVEVHNYNVRSSDITFGMALSVIQPLQSGADSDPKLQLQYSANMLTLSWTGGFTLQSASSPEGPWEDAPSASPFSTPPSEAHRYYRLRK